jgi:hypothetical protein
MEAVRLAADFFIPGDAPAAAVEDNRGIKMHANVLQQG